MEANRDYPARAIRRRSAENETSVNRSAYRPSPAVEAQIGLGHVRYRHPGHAVFSPYPVVGSGAGRGASRLDCVFHPGKKFDGAIAGVEDGFASIGDEHYRAPDDIDELVFVSVPMTLTGPGPRA
jgi:hypothetical protein